MHRQITLPTELLDSILSDDQLSKADLVRCCLVDRHFLLSARPLIYRHVRIKATSLCRTVFGKRTCIDSSSQLLFRSITANVTLSHHIRQLQLSDNVVDRCDKSLGAHYRNVAEVFEECLLTMPQLNSLKVNETCWKQARVRELLSENGSRWYQLEVEGFDLTTSRVSRWAGLSELRKLRIWDVEDDIWSISGLTDKLDTLDLTWKHVHTVPLEFPSNSKLRVLRLPMSDHKITSIGLCQELVHLYLKEGFTYEPLVLSSFAQIAQLSRLKSLSVHFKSSFSMANFLPPLFNHLPTSLTRLDFPGIPPVFELSNFLQNNTPPLLRIIGCNPEPSEDNQKPL